MADLDRLNVELGVITGRDCETTYGFPANNQSVLEFCRAYPKKFVGFWGIDPHKKMAALREIAHVASEYGMKGIAIDPYPVSYTHLDVYKRQTLWYLAI